MITVRDVRKPTTGAQATGTHALIAITAGEKVLGHDTFNLARSEDRTRLANRAHSGLGTITANIYSKDDLRHDLDLITLWLMRHYEQDRFGPEKIPKGTQRTQNVFKLHPYILSQAGTILFGKPGAGKSYICQAMAICMSAGINGLWSIQKQIPTYYVNLERPKLTMINRDLSLCEALNLDGSSEVDYLHARGKGLPTINASISKWTRANPDGVVILDSISRSGLGDLNTNDAGNNFINTMNSLECSWIGIGHSPRGDDTHVYGSMMFEAGQDIGIQALSERKGNTNGVALKVTKANDMRFPPVSYLALEFTDDDDDDSRLISIREARKSEFPELSISGPVSRTQQALNFLHDQPDGTASVKEIAEGIDMAVPNCSVMLKEGDSFQSLPKEGRGRRYRPAVQENTYGS
jgi:hypothetical protein